MAASRLHPGAAVLALAGAVIVGSGTARAADLLPPPPPAELPIEVGTGWYLRGDFTGTFYDRPTDATPADPNDPGMPPLVRLRLTSTDGYGGGVGYKLNPWLRIDATFDQRTPSRFSAYSSRSNFQTGYNVEAGQLDVLTGLVNVYADLGTWWGLTPYIGGGVGFAETNFRRGYTQTTCLVDACDGIPGIGPRDAAPRPRRSVTSFAWALTAGVSYEIAAGLSLDAGYRFVDLGEARSGVDAFGGSTRLRNLTANEVRVGLRYLFAGGPSLLGGEGALLAPSAYGN